MTDGAPKKVLIVKMWALGDLLMATPILTALKIAYPGCEITWLTDKFYAEVLRGNPNIDHLIEIDSGTWTRLFRKAKLAQFWRESMKMRRELQETGFDIVVNLIPEKWWTVFFLIAPERIALYPTAKATWTRRWHTQDIVRKDDSSHALQHYVLAAKAAGCASTDFRMTIGETPAEAPFITRFWQQHALSDTSPTVVLAPFGSFENRGWEPELCAELAARLADEYSAQVIVISSPKYRKTAAEIAQLASRSSVISADETTVRDMIALIRRADLAISVDSGPMHIAAALGKPFIALFGPGIHQKWFPLCTDGTLLYRTLRCAPCQSPTCANPVFRQCMKQITVEDVLSAVKARMGWPSALS